MNKRAAFVALLFVLPTSLISPVMGENETTSGRVNDGMCELYDPLAGGGILTVPSGECAVYDVDEYAVGTVLEMTFDVSSTQIWDLLVFEESDYSTTYKGGQSNYPDAATKYATTMFGITQIVDRDDFKLILLARFEHGPEHIAADPAKTINCYFDRHGFISLFD